MCVLLAKYSLAQLRDTSSSTLRPTNGQPSDEFDQRPECASGLSLLAIEDLCRLQTLARAKPQFQPVFQ